MFKFILIIAAASVLGGQMANPPRPDQPPPKRGPPASSPPISEDLVAFPELSDGTVSPSGRYVAMVARSGLYDNVIVFDRVENKRAYVFSETADQVVFRGVWWKGDERLVLSYTRRTIKYSGYRPSRSRGGPSQLRTIVRIEDVIATTARDGSDRVELGFGSVIDALPGQADEILVGVRGRRQDPTPGIGAVLIAERVNIRTGAGLEVARGTSKTLTWEVDRTGRLVMRYDDAGRGGGLRFVAPDADNVWREIFTIREKDLRSLPDLEILGPSPEPGKLYVAVKPTDRSAGDRRELRVFDFATRTMGAKIWAHPDYDLDSIILDSSDGSVAGMCYWADVLVCDYVDASAQREFAALRSFFDGERSIRNVSSSRDGVVQLLLVSGPDEPGTYYVYDHKTRRVDVVGQLYSALHPDRLGIMSRYTYAARDGFQLRGYLTEPPERPKGKLPLIVMPHGGPEIRDHFDFDPWVQGFASRGYLVFQPNFRGSGGFGAAFGEMGYGQWGLRMQDDVMDGVRSLIASGRVDPERICIVGASYGGYVALYAGAREPDIFKCVVSIAGVSDLVSIQNWELRESGPDSLRYRYWLRSIGDPQRDRPQLVATSPITYAPGFRAPVLLMHGDKDDIVPVAQSVAMQAALKRAGKDVQFQILEDENHNGWSIETRHTVLNGMLDFVTKAIGPGSPSAPVAK